MAMRMMREGSVRAHVLRLRVTDVLRDESIETVSLSSHCFFIGAPVFLAREFDCVCLPHNNFKPDSEIDSRNDTHSYFAPTTSIPEPFM